MADRLYSNEPPHERVNSPADAFWTMRPSALIDADDAWYVDIDAIVGAQHYGVKQSIIRGLRPNRLAGQHIQMGLLGAKGSGKTTQVRQALAALDADGVVPAYVDAQAAFDESDLAFADFVLVVAAAAAGLADERGWPAPAKEFESVVAWFAEELVTETSKTEAIGAVDASAELGGGLPGLAKLLAKLTATLRGSHERRQEIRQKVNRDPAELLRRVNEVLDRVSARLPAPYKRIVVVFDNLEKIPERELVEKAVLLRAGEIKQLRCSLLLLLDPADEYAPKQRRASEALEDFYLVPMLPVRAKDDERSALDPSVRRTVAEMLDRRADVQRIFADPEWSIDQLAIHSGGRVRDVFHLARYACRLAGDGPKVTRQHIEVALAAESANRADSVPPDGWRRLAEIAQTKRIANSELDHQLILHSHVLQYNGQPWWDVHPLLALDPQFAAAVKVLGGDDGGD